MILGVAEVSQRSLFYGDSATGREWAERREVFELKPMGISHRDKLASRAKSMACKAQDWKNVMRKLI